MKKLLLLLALFTGLSFSNRAFAQTYCTTNLYSSNCTYGDDLDDVIIGNFSHLNTGCSANGYGDYTTDTLMIPQSTPTAVGLTSNFSSQWYAIWIDINSDGDFDDAGEHLWSSTAASGSAGSTTSGSIVIDTSISTGTYRLRVRGKYAGSAILANQSCSSFSYGEVHDYTVTVLPPPACPAPYAVTASNISSTSATISWTGVGTAFVVQHDTTGFALGTGDSTTSSSSSVSLTGLMPNTYYDVYVRNNCSGSGNGQSLWSAVATFKTGCVAFSTPFSEDFESTTAGSTSNPSPPDCWSFARTSHGGAGYSYTRNYSTWANNSSQFWYTYTSTNYSTGDTMALISPEINNMDSLDMQLEFYARAGYSGTSYSEVIYVGTISDPSDLSTMSILDTVSIAGILTYTNFLFYFDASNGYNGTDKHIVIVPSSANTTYDYVCIDDITVEEIPPCPKPLYPTFTNITSNSANMSFSSGGSKFVIEYGPCGFNQGTGMFDTLYTNSTTLTGLTQNTEYQVYIQSDCSGSGNGLSSWALSDCFKTECAPQMVPLSENFDGVASGSTADPSPPDCFKYTMTQNGGYGYGYTRNYSPYANSGSQFFYMYHSNTTDTMALVTPAIAGMDTSYKHITFWARSTSSARSEHIIIGTVPSPTSLAGFSAIDTVPINSTTYQYHDVYIDMANGYNGSDMYIALALWTGTSYTYGYACIDDIGVADIPSCIPSTNLTAGAVTNNSAALSWTAGDGSVYNLEYGPTGFTQGTGGPIVTGITSTNYTLTNLSANTCYDVYIRDSCSSGYSPWFGPITFCTACNPLSTPFTEDFEGVSGGGNTVDPNLPDCWSYWTSGTYYGYTYASLGPNGSYHWRFYNFSNVDTVALISPLVDGIGGGTKMIKFKNKSYYTSTAYPDGIAMEVGTSPSAANIKNGTAIDTVYGDYGQNYVNEFQVYLDTASGYNGTDGYIYMRPLFESGKWYAYNFVDDIKVEDIPTCAAPWNLSASNITSSTADANWTTIYGTAFQVEYGPTGFIPGTGNGDTINNVMSGATMTGLAPNTYYDFYVSDNCNPSDQAGPFTFKTECTTQLSGNYTVGGPTADFQSLDSAIALLAGCGVSGPTTLTLQQSDTAQAMVFGAITGVNSTNTVTIKGSSSAGTDTIYLMGGANAGIEMGSTSYLSFEDLTITGGATGFMVWMYGGANHIAFDNCNMIIPPSTSTTTGLFNISSSATSISGTGDNASDIDIMNCTLDGGGVGVNLYGGSTTSRIMNFNIENNVMNNGVYGLRAYYIDGLNIEGNVMNIPGSYGCYIYYPWNIDIIGNQMYSATYAVYCYRPNYLNPSTTNGRVENNFIGSGTYGFYGGYWEDLDFIHNSFGGGTYGCYVYGMVDDCEFRNNIFVGGSSYALYNSATSTSTTNTSVDYNIYYTQTGSTVANWTGTAYTTLTAWQAADTTKNANSLEGDPGYVSATDYHIVGTLPNDAADNNTSVVEDIDGDTRPASGATYKDIGADEFTPLLYDAALESIDVALAGCGDSATEVSVTVKNFGQNDIMSLPITVMVSGGVTATLNYTTTDTIVSSQSKTYMVGTVNTYSGVTGVMFDGYTSLSGDQKTSNDTINNVGPGSYTPYEPQYYMPDTICASEDSATMAAVTYGGVQYGWYANASDTIPVGIGDSFTFSLSGQTTWYLGYLSNADSLLTTFAAGNGQNGNIFDINVINGVAINGFTINAQGAGTAEVWYRSGSYVGYENSSAGWTNLTTTAVPVAGSGAQYVGLPSPLVLGSGIHAFYVTMSSGSVSYTNGSTVGSVYASNSDIIFYEGVGKSYPFGSTFSPRVWNGVIHYGSQGCSDNKKMLVQGLNTDTAVADFSHTVQTNGADVDFDASASYGHTYEWTFGDGGVAVGTTPMVSHTYAQAGTYTACLKVIDTICNSSDSICYTVTATVGIEESLLNQSLVVFPNPNNGKFRVEFQVEGLRDIEVRVVTLLGQTIHKSEPGRISGTYSEDIDLSQQAAGVYLLQIVTEEDAVTRQITIRK